jgi:hypothetical protein
MPKEVGNHTQHTIQLEATAQGGPERQPPPSVLDILERRAQIDERYIARESRKFSREENKAHTEEWRAADAQLTNELARLYIYGTNSDRLIMIAYATLAKSQHPKFDVGDGVNLHSSLYPHKAREFLSRVTPLYDNEEALREELRKAEEVVERKRAALRHREEYRLLPPEEAAQRRRKVKRESYKCWYQRTKEERGLQAEQQPPAQVFPPPTTQK